MQTYVSTATIRQRGQLTIPNEIRERLAWVDINEAVRIKTEGDKKIIIEPYEKENKVDWKKLRAQLKRVANYKGERGNLSQFIIEDRERH